ncbi:MAG: trypsin-like peptidase domain-containing protein [Christensenellaceae bacterium]|jgi:S1-C subfamily serine protease|nr:trypsin-like peptidase domain-containing protein [Christensenellaceae bacterium]
MKKLLTFFAVIFVGVTLTACDVAGNFENTTPPQTIYETKYETTTIYQTLDINELYELYKTEILAEDPNAVVTFGDFIQYLSLNVSDTEYASSIGIKSVVSIFSTFQCREYFRIGKQSYYNDYTVQGAGSGVIYKISEDNDEEESVYIVTNYHVIYDANCTTDNRIANEISVYSYDAENTAINATFVDGDIENDIAVLKADKSDFSNGVVAVTIADHNQLKAGQTAVAIGNSLGAGLKVTAGIISDTDEEITMEALDPDDPDGEMTLHLIQTDTAINAGNSGGGLFNARGELVGIVNAKMVQSGVENTGYAIPLNTANKKILDDIINAE